MQLVMLLQASSKSTASSLEGISQTVLPGLLDSWYSAERGLTSAQLGLNPAEAFPVYSDCDSKSSCCTTVC